MYNYDTTIITISYGIVHLCVFPVVATKLDSRQIRSRVVGVKLLLRFCELCSYKVNDSNFILLACDKHSGSTRRPNNSSEFA